MNMCRHFTPPFFQPTATQRGFYYRALKTWNNLSVSTKKLALNFTVQEECEQRNGA